MNSSALSVTPEVDGNPNIVAWVVSVDLDEESPTARLLLLSELEVRTCSKPAKDVPGSVAAEVFKLLACDNILSFALHHPLNVDSGTPMSRATAAFDSPL